MISKKNIILFDVDGTLADSGQQIDNFLLERLSIIKNKGFILGIIGGGNYEKIKYQIKNSPIFDYIFCECGSQVYYQNKLIENKNFISTIDRDKLNSIIKLCLKEIVKMPILLHGHQIDFRNGLIYISPPGLQATPLERQIFKEMDTKLNLRKKLINKIQKKIKKKKIDLEIVLGGEVGLALYPFGWNKSQIMKYFDKNDYKVYFFGDKTEPDGNDYPLYSHPEVIGFSVINKQDTFEKIKIFI